MVKNGNGAQPPSMELLRPVDIRRIRKSLGLTQVEAGELLGGGPRAFSKYEGGTIRPSASTSSLLRLLDANPSAITALTGSKTVQIASDNVRPFQVSGEHVAALGARKLVLLVRKLLKTEAFDSNLPEFCIHVAENITAADGGEDGRIEWQGGPDRTDYLPNRLCQFQMKAGDISPSEAAADVQASSGVLKEMVERVLESGGTYIMLCGHSYTKQLIDRRRQAVIDKIIGCGLRIMNEQVQFRDADQIANWVNDRPTVAIWLLEQTQPGIVGPFKDWTHWAGRYEHDSSPWIEDSRLPEFRRSLHELIEEPKGVARVIGLSGVGKSRFALEALGPSMAKEGKDSSLSDIVLYTVESEVGPEAIHNGVQILVDAGVRAVVVVDKCSGRTHNEIAATCKRSGSRISLVTIDHDFTDKEKAYGDRVFLDHAPEEVVSVTIERLLPEIPSEDRRRLLKFSRGFPRIAQLLANAWLQEIPIASASDEDLISQIILGRNPRDPGLVLSVAQLVSTFNLVGFEGGAECDLDDLASLSDTITSEDIRVCVTELIDRGVCQQRGRLVVLQPKPIALSLAAAQWKRWSQAQWDDVLSGALTSDLRLRAAQQLALLNTRTIATKVVRHVCRLGGPFDSLDAIARIPNTEVISSLAEVDATIVAELIENVLTPLSTDELSRIDGDTRRHLVWALEKVSFLRGTFELGAKLLLDLAVAENESWGNNSVGQFKALFPALLADTEAPPGDRIRFLDDELQSEDRSRIEIVTEALIEGASVRSFTRSVGSETHGSRPSLESWQPKTWTEAWDYVTECGDRLAALAVRADDLGATARGGLGNRFREYVARGLIDKVEEWVGFVTAKTKYWPEALASLGDVFQYDADGLSSEVEERIRVLVDRLAPKTAEDRVKFLITEMPWDYPCDEKLSYDERNKRQGQAVEDLAIELLGSPQDLLAYLPSLSVSDQRQATAFGHYIAMHAENPIEWLEAARSVYTQAPPSQRNFSLLAGVASGLKTRRSNDFREFKKRASGSEELADCLPFVCLRAGIEDEDIGLVCAAVEADILSAGQLANWTLGGELAQRSPAIVAPLLTLLFVKGGSYYSIGLDVMGMYVHRDKNRLESLRPQLLLAAERVGSVGNESRNQVDSHHFKEMMVWLLDQGNQDRDASKVASELAAQLAENPRGSTERLTGSLLPKLLSEFPDIVWPHLSSAIADSKEKGWLLQMALGDRHSFRHDESPAILHLSEEMLFAWCHANPEVGPAFLAGVAPMLTSRDPTLPNRDFHPLTKRLLDEFGERGDVQSALSSNMHTFGWSGSLTTYFALYEQPIKLLEDHPSRHVRRWGRKMLQNIRRDIEREKDRDDEQDAHWD